MRLFAAFVFCALIFSLAGCSKETKAVLPNNTALAGETGHELNAAGGSVGGSLDMKTGKTK